MNEENYSIVIETMKQMYEKKILTIANIKASFNKSQITLQEYNYILGKK